MKNIAQKMKAGGKIVAAIWHLEPNSTSVQIITTLQDDLKSGKQSLLEGTLEYLPLLRNNVTSEVLALLLGQERNANVSKLLPHRETYKILVTQLHFTPNEALVQSLKIQKKITEALTPINPGGMSPLQLGLAKIDILMGTQRLDWTTVCEKILDPEQLEYVPGLQLWHLQELIAPSVKLDLLISAREMQLERDYEDLMDEKKIPYNASMIHEIAKRQVMFNDYELPPIIKNLTKPSESLALSQNNLSTGLLLSSYTFLSSQAAEQNSEILMILTLLGLTMLCYLIPKKPLYQASQKLIGCCLSMFDRKAQGGNTHIVVPAGTPTFKENDTLTSPFSYTRQAQQ